LIDDKFNDFEPTNILEISVDFRSSPRSGRGRHRQKCCPLS